ncbi:GumC family protein (plasmid) [Sphingomonas carotinifaciens]|uniref:GumC family protein n=1 Tax=Sphingomonas carotinifaciens TaxID=1166323 RepID=UPI0039A29CF7
MNRHSPQAEHDDASRFDQSRHLGRRAVTLRSVGDAIRRRWIIVVACALTVFAIALGTALMLTPKYDAFAKVRITPNAASPLDFGNGTEQPADQTAVNTEVQVIGSRNTARQVVTQLDLNRDPEFAGEGPAGTAIERATSNVLDSLKINRDEKSYLVHIGIRSVDPTKAAKIANTYASTYVAGTADNLMGTAAKQSTSIQNRLRELGAEVQAADARLAAYRAQSGISQTGQAGTITDQQIAPLSMQLATAESEAAAARSALSVAERQSATGGTDAISAVLSSSVIADLRRQRTEAEKRRAELSARYGPRYPLSVQIAQQIESLDEQIKQEAQRVVGGLRSQALSAEARANSLRGRLNTLQRGVARDDQASVMAGSLERDAEAKRTAYTRLAQAAQQSTQAQRVSAPQASIVENATVPTRPTFPKVKAFAAAGLLIGIVVGLGAVLLSEGLSSTIRKPEDIETLLGLSFVASIPRLPGRSRLRGKRTSNPAKTLVSKPMTVYAEAYRAVRSFIATTDQAEPARVIALASTLPGEGKTTSSLSLARVMAMSGDRVLLIDCDVRRAGVLRALDRTVETGLTDVLEGRTTMAKAVVRDEVEGLDMLLVQGSLFTPTDLFGSGRMEALLAEARAAYDYVILDTPPLLGIADARTLVGLADAVMLVIKWNATPIAAVDAALAGLEHGQGHVLGAVMTMVDHRSEAMGGLYYSARYSSYYNE